MRPGPGGMIKMDAKARHVPGRGRCEWNNDAGIHLDAPVAIGAAAARDVPRSDWSVYPFLITLRPERTPSTKLINRPSPRKVGAAMALADRFYMRDSYH